MAFLTKYLVILTKKSDRVIRTVWRPVPPWGGRLAALVIRARAHTRDGSFASLDVARVAGRLAIYCRARARTRTHAQARAKDHSPFVYRIGPF